MAHFASPFFQNIISLTKDCVPKPTESVYKSDFVQTLAKCELENLSEGCKLRVPPLGLKMPPVCSDKAESGEKNEKPTMPGHICAKRISTYMVSYKHPDEIIKMGKRAMALKQIEQEHKDQKEILVWTEGKENPVILENPLEAQPVEEKPLQETGGYANNKQYAVPKWKANGWKAKKICWLTTVEACSKK